MGRIINVFLVLLMIGGAAATYELKDRAGAAAKRVARLHINIGKEKEAIALLKAEWSVLSQPSRLQSVTERYADHFRLAPFSVDQVATLDQIPMRPPASPVGPPRAVADAGPATR